MRNRTQDLEDVKTKGFFDESYTDYSRVNKGIDKIVKLIAWSKIDLPEKIRIEINKLDSNYLLSLLAKYSGIDDFNQENRYSVAEHIESLIDHNKIPQHVCNEDIYLGELYDRQSGHTLYKLRCSVCAKDTSRWNDEY